MNPVESISIARAKRNAERFSASISMVETAISAAARGCLVEDQVRPFVIAEAAVGDLIQRMGGVAPAASLLREVLGRYEDKAND